MKLTEAIDRIDEIKPNGFSKVDKIGWVSELEGRIYLEIVKTHEGYEDVEFDPVAGYSDEDEDEELLVPHPYDDIYVKWLEACIDYANGEYTRYNNSMQMFNTKYSAFANQYNKVHMPLGTGIRYY